MIAFKPALEADLLIVGGGIAGLMAAITAAEAGNKNVLILEKSHARRSGSGATGNDHFSCYIPEFHGPDMEPVLQQFLHSMMGRHKDPAIMRLFLQESESVVRKWEEWGIAMRPTGKWECMGHAFPGKPRFCLKYNGANQKAVLVGKCKELGVKILNHHPVMELAVEDGRIAGALALDMSGVSGEAPAFVPVRAKTVLLATGLTHRLYTTAPTPAYMFNTGHCPNCAGGQGLGWRVGARMVNMELPYTHAGPKYFGRCGKATWIGVYRYADGRPLGPFVTKSNREYGDVTGDVWNTAFQEVMQNGSGPVYMDCSDASREDLDYMHHAMISEGLTGLLNYMASQDIDPGKDAVEFMRYEPVLHGRGLDVNENGETTVPGLFAAGDMAGNAGCGIGLAAWLGWRCGREAARQAAQGTFKPVENNAALLARAALLSELYERPEGAPWQDANFALQQVMSDYAAAGPTRVRSATLLNAGLTNLHTLKRRTLSDMKASCPHTLMRCAEVLDLFDCGEAIIHAALARKESREAHLRSDFTFTNPLLADKYLTVGLSKPGQDEVITEWRPIRY